MNINFENYEEYFLLYADNELNAGQKQIVEMFVKSNPVLQKEFDDILATIQKPDDISIQDKSFLYKNSTDTFIDRGNYVQRFVEYHDDELNDAERKAVEKFSLSGSGLKNELDLIGQARLEPDNSIIYPDKEKLYHSISRVYPLRFLKIAVAAALTGLIIWLGYGLFTDNENASNPVIVSSVVKPDKGTVPRPTQTEKAVSGEKPGENMLVSNNTRALNNPHKNYHYANHPSKENNSETRKDEEVKTINPLNAGLNTQTMETIGKVDVDITDVIEIPRSELRILAVKAPLTNEIQTQSPAATNARFATFSYDQPNEEYVFYDIPVDNLKQSKLGGFIKKIRRTIDRNNPINRLFNVEEAE